MEDIAKMADECMRNVDEDDDEDVEDDEDLLVCAESCILCFRMSESCSQLRNESFSPLRNE